MSVEVNYLAVFLAMLSSMVIGSVWYARSVFGETWIKLAKVDMSKGKQANVWKPIALTAIVSLVTAYVLAHVTFQSHQYFGDSFFSAALQTAFWAWLGFTAARFVTHDAFEGRPAKLTVLNCAHELVTIVTMGIIIGLMGI